MINYECSVWLLYFWHLQEKAREGHLDVMKFAADDVADNQVDWDGLP